MPVKNLHDFSTRSKTLDMGTLYIAYVGTELLIITEVAMVCSIKVELYLASTPHTIWYNYLDNPINKEISR